MDEIMESLLCELEEHMEDGVCNMNVDLAGAVVDMIKDLAMAKYYCAVVEAMKKGEKIPYVNS